MREVTPTEQISSLAGHAKRLREDLSGDSELSKIRRIQNGIVQIFRNSYLPSRNSFFLVLGVTSFVLLLPLFWPSRFLFWIIPKSCGPYEFIDHAIIIYDAFFWAQDVFANSSNLFSYVDLVEIHAGIGAIIFALLIFVAESLRDESSKDRARVLLKESYLFPITVAEIVIFFFFCITPSKNSPFSVFAVVVVGLLTIFSLSKIISVLSIKNRFFKRRVALLVDRLLQSIDNAIEERLGQNELLKRLSSEDIQLTYNPYSVDDLSNYYVFGLERTGLVKDINLSKLKELSNYIERKSNKQGYTFTEDSSSREDVKVSDEIALESDSAQKKLTNNDQRFLTKLINGYISESDEEVLLIQKCNLKEEDCRYIEIKLKEVFSIEDGEESFSESVRDELIELRDQMVQAIQTKNIGKLEDGRKIYINIAEVFVDHFAKYGTQYSFKEAVKERTSLYGGWNEIGWLVDDIRDLFDAAIEEKSLAVIREISYLPSAITKRAVSKNDQYLFQEFLRLHHYLYFMADRLEGDARKFLEDRSFRYLQETVTYFIAPRLRKETDEEGLRSIKDFIVYTMFIFNDLLKSASDKDDEESFDAFISSILKSYKFETYRSQRHDIEILDIRLRSDDLDSEQLGDLQTKRKTLVALKELWEEIDLRQQQLFFGLAAWLLDKVISEKDGRTLKYFKKLRGYLPTDPIKLLKFFDHTHSFDTEDFWNWNRWERIPDGEVRWIDFLGKLKTLFCLLMLEGLRGKDASWLNENELPVSQHLATFNYKETRDRFIGIVDRLKSCTEITTDDLFDKSDLFFEVLSKIGTEQEIKEKIYIRDTNISSSEVEKFRSGNLESYKKNASLKKVFSKLNLIIDKSEERLTEPMDRFGANKLDQKEAFFESWHVHFIGRDEQYGRSMANGENSSLLKKIKACCEKKSLDEVLEYIDNYDKKSDLLALTSSFKLRGDWFIPEWQLREESFVFDSTVGCIQSKTARIPIVSVLSQVGENFLLLLDKKRLGNFIQLSPLAADESEQFMIDQFYFQVEDLNQNRDSLEKIMNESLDWLKEKGSEDDQREYLREKVIVRIYSRFSFEPSPDFFGYYVPLSE